VRPDKHRPGTHRDAEYYENRLDHAGSADTENPEATLIETGASSRLSQSGISFEIPEGPNPAVAFYLLRLAS
jgi:hypothetical protein